MVNVASILFTVPSWLGARRPAHPAGGTRPVGSTLTYDFMITTVGRKRRNVLTLLLRYHNVTWESFSFLESAFQTVSLKSSYVFPCTYVDLAGYFRQIGQYWAS